jgi:protein O-GlcNAc transferase
VTFGCFSNPTKFTDELFTAWAKVLAAVPGSRLVLKGMDFEQDEVRRLMIDRLVAAGIPMDRLELLPRTPDTASHLAQYARVDVVLDTFPYTGTTTTCEALWMGRPVVTLAGNRHAGRVGASLLAAVGRSEWIADDTARYVSIAAQLAADPSKLVQQSESLRSAVQHSPLMDHIGQSARFASALRECWREKTVAMTECSCGSAST